MIPFFKRFSAALVAGIPLFVGPITSGYGAPSQPPPPKKTNGVAASPKPATPARNQWTLRDYFHNEWRNELVTYPVDAKTAANDNLSLVGASGTPLSYQWLREGTQNKIAFMADIPVDGENTYRLVPGAPQTQTDLKVEESDEEIRLSNARTGIAIRKTLADGQAPIAAIKLASGKWIGDSVRAGTPALQDYTAQVVQQGPVLAEVLCEAKFEGGKNWRLRFRLLASEATVTASESSSVGPGASWRLRLDKGFAPSKVFRRNPLNKTILTAPIPAADGTVCTLEPWLQWWQTTNGTWFSLYNDADADLLSLGATDASLWVDLNKPAGTPQAAPRIPIVTQGGALYANFDLTGGVRRWLISSQDKNESLKLLGGKDSTVAVTTPAHRLVIKYGDFPLDKVKDYVLDWPETAEHPRFLVAKSDAERFKATYKVEPAQLAFGQGKLNYLNVMNALPVYLATGDEKVGRSIAAIALEMMQTQTDNILQQDLRGSLNAWPHNQQGINPTFNVVDIAWPAFTPEERRRVRAQAALIGYTVNRPDYWSVGRGFHANPNMTTMVATYQAGAGALLADHPMSDKWLESGMAEAKQQITNWSDDNGGWLEAPHYATVSYDNLLGMFLMARSKDGGALLYSDKMKKVARFFAMISTPPDAGVGGLRHMPRIGNTWLDEPSGVYGYLAALWKDRDPQFASEMQWMYLQQGSWPDNGIGGRFPTFEGLNDVFRAPTIPAVKPAYKSALFPRTGVSLRNTVDDRETQLYLIAGTNHDHYDNDSGSITLWGKGRIVANDFAYGQAAEMAPSAHSLVEGGGRTGLMAVKSFQTTPHFDSVRGVSGEWQRQIAFIKDSDVLAPNYFVVRDTIGKTTPGTWRLWLDGKINLPSAAPAPAPGLQLQSVQVAGRDDVDTDIALVTSGPAPLTTQDKTSTTFGVGPDKKAAGNRSVPLTALIANLSTGQDVLTVIYPRLKTQQTPKVTPLADGRVLKVVHSAGTDYIFLADKSFTFTEGDIQFEGTSGLVKIRGDEVFLALGEPGKLSARGQTAAPATPTEP